METTTMSEPMDGRAYFRALSYAMAAVPTDDDHTDLQHVTFMGQRIIGADGERRHDGYVPVPLETISVTRLSARDLLMMLDFANRYSKRRQVSFSVRHDGDEVRIEYGARQPLVYPLERCDVGSHPETFNEWVPVDAPLNPTGLGHIACGHLKDAMSWWRSWDKDQGTSEIRGGVEGGPTRIDITCNGTRVATAFVMPLDHPAAELRDKMPLFDGIKASGRSNLDLDITGDGMQQPTTIKIGDVELNVTGLGNPADLLVTGPCQHRDTDEACLPCTEDRILAKRNEPPKKKRKRKADETAEAAAE